MRKCEEIATKCFAHLYLDSEYEDIVFCRVTIEDVYQGIFTAKNREEAIEIFRSGKWREVIES